MCTWCHPNLGWYHPRLKWFISLDYSGGSHVSNVLSMTLNCSSLCTTPHQTMTQLQLDDNHNADLLDAMADMAHEQDQAMRESSQEDWEGVIYDDEDAP